MDSLGLHTNGFTLSPSQLPATASYTNGHATPPEPSVASSSQPSNGIPSSALHPHDEELINHLYHGFQTGVSDNA